MSQRTLERIKLGFNAQTGEVLIYSHGVNPGLPLFSRPAMRELLTVFVGMLMMRAGEGETSSALAFPLGKQWYRVSAEMIEDPTKVPEETPPEGEETHAMTTTGAPSNAEA